MELTVVFAALTVFLLITALLYRLGKKSDQMRRRLTAIREQDANPLNEELKKPLTERILKPLAAALKGVLRKGIPGKKNKKTSKSKEKTLRLLEGADIELSYEVFCVVKLAAAVVLAVCGYYLMKTAGQEGTMQLLGGVLGLAIGCWAPLFAVRKKQQARNASILRDLPEVMDLLVVSVEAGLGLDAAIVRLYDKNRSPLLLELMGTVRDVQMGLPRRESLKAMADRSQVQELKTFATAIIQAEQLGVSIKNVLRSQAEQLRLAYRQRCEAKAMKAPIKMMIPMVMFIFPVLFIILLGPSVTRIQGLF